MTTEEMVEFTMPETFLGDQVTYYPNANPTNGQPIIGNVIRVNMRSVDISLPESAGKVVRGVRNVNDPELLKNMNYRMVGAWDTTERYRRLERAVKMLAERVATLERKKT